MSYEKELSVGIQACLQAAKLCERIRSTIPKAIEKLDQSPVTVRLMNTIVENNLNVVSRFWFTSIDMFANSS